MPWALFESRVELQLFFLKNQYLKMEMEMTYFALFSMGILFIYFVNHYLYSKRITTPPYFEYEYWEKRYQKQPCVYEWYLSSVELQRIPLISMYGNKGLEIGCGTSQWASEMTTLYDNKISITSIDYSNSCIAFCQDMDPHRKTSYLCKTCLHIDMLIY